MGDVNFKDILAGAGTGAAAGTTVNPGWGTFIGGVVGAGAALIGDLTAPELKALYGDIDIPTLQQMIASGQVAGPSEMMKLQANPAQLAALKQLQEVGSAGGLDPQSVAAQQQALYKSAQQDQANRAAVLSGMAQRGQMSGGAGLAGQLAGQQESTQANAMAATQASADARTRALQAMQGAGQLGGQLWNQEAAKAQAQDQINQFNATNALKAQQIGLAAQFAKAGGQLGATKDQAAMQNAAATGGAQIGGSLVKYAGNALQPQDNESWWQEQKAAPGTAPVVQMPAATVNASDPQKKNQVRRAY